MTRSALAAVAVAALAQGAASPSCRLREALPRPAAPATIQGGAIVEPPELGIGETATVEIAVVTPPDHRLEPLEAPEEVPGLWVLSAEMLATRREAGRAVHRQRFQVRARATGELAWPAQTAFVLTPRGERLPVEIGERPIRVLETAREFPGRTEPFSWRAPRDPGRASGFALPAAFGAAAALAAVAVAVLVRRAREARAAAEHEPLAEALYAPARAAAEALAAALARVEVDAAGAAGAASAALRRFVADRSRIPALASTTEELAATTPPWLLARRWPELLELLRGLDEARFRAGGLASAEARAELRERIRAAEALVGESVPQTALRETHAAESAPAAP